MLINMLCIAEQICW